MDTTPFSADIICEQPLKAFNVYVVIDYMTPPYTAVFEPSIKDALN